MEQVEQKKYISAIQIYRTTRWTSFEEKEFLDINPYPKMEESFRITEQPISMNYFLHVSRTDSPEDALTGIRVITETQPVPEGYQKINKIINFNTQQSYFLCTNRAEGEGKVVKMAILNFDKRLPFKQAEGWTILRGICGSKHQQPRKLRYVHISYKTE